MKKITLLLLLVLSQTVFAHTQLTETQKLAATCKVWGFLKYYHPKVADGSKNWDEQLFIILPLVEKAQTKEEFSMVLESLIDGLGEVKKIAPIAIPKGIEYFDKNFDLSWINNNKLFSKNLSGKLKFIAENRFQGDQYYVDTHEDGNIFIKNENYSAYKFKDKNIQILTFFMYWNVIEYFFPYKYLMDQQWDVTLEKMLPFFIEAKNENEFYTAMQKVTVALNDTHTTFYTDDSSINGTYFLPDHYRIIDDKLIVTEILNESLAKEHDIKIGDVITKLNGKTVKQIILENRELINGSNEAAYLNNLVDSPILDSAAALKMEFLKDGVTTTKTINDYYSNNFIYDKNRFNKGIKKEKFKILDNSIGYVDMGILRVNNVPEMIEKLASTKAIIFDMRNYPHETYEVISNFLNANQEKFVIYTKPDLKHPGRFQWTEPQFTGRENKNNYKGKVVVLLNEKSMSQSEWTAMCFQTAGNTTIIGSQTAGADGNVTDILIKDISTRISGLGVYYPDKRETQRIGIIPDIEIKPTIKGIQEGKDEVLDRALQFIETGK
ncbi:S41 family peptidase [Flavobacterium sp. N3904]|uniref:S41 family peptidase n=1 Tax=Flavobacterium sp. N3904 TaxID=2986835 RepID=UPI002224ED18|nr:S41 family peptidase [Flavobacterium sp. N3904]